MRIVTGTLLLLSLLCAAQTGAAGEAAITARLLVSNPAPYLGEEIDLLLEITYNRHPGGRTRFSWPNLDNFVAADPGDIRSQLYRDSQNRLVETVSRRVRPIKSGEITLRLALVSTASLNIRPAPLTLRVRPLPVTNRPDRFSNHVGHYRLKLETDGSGGREIRLHIFDSNQLAPLPSVIASPQSAERLIRLDTVTRPTRDGGREHIFRYAYTPGRFTTDELRFFLPVFDPERQSYLEIETKPAVSRTAWPLIPLLLSGAILVMIGRYRLWRKRHPRTITGCIDQLCQRPAAGLCRNQIELLLHRYLDQEDKEALLQQWQKEDALRFSPMQPPALSDLRFTAKSLRRQLWKSIDKQRDNP